MRCADQPLGSPLPTTPWDDTQVVRSPQRGTLAPLFKLAETQVGHVHTCVVANRCLGPCVVNLLTGYPSNFNNQISIRCGYARGLSTIHALKYDRST